MGLLSELNLPNKPWCKVAVDLIGPWSTKTEHFNGEFYALKCIDTTTNLVKLVCIDSKLIDAIARKFENTWLAQYPRPVQAVQDNSGEFTGYAFDYLLNLLGIQDIPTTNKKPKSNAMQMYASENGIYVKGITLFMAPTNTTKCLAS